MGGGGGVEKEGGGRNQAEGRGGELFDENEGP